MSRFPYDRSLLKMNQFADGKFNEKVEVPMDANRVFPMLISNFL